jgi:ABC-2 type transport system permease protein
MGPLLWKELRQLPRKRGVLASALLLPLLLLLVLPLGQMLALARLPAATAAGSRVSGGLPGTETMQAISHDPSLMFRLMTFPLIVIIGGLIGPNVLATHSVVVERERRTLDLLAALPVTLSDILQAKLLATVLISAVIAVPLLAIDAAAALFLGLASIADVAAMAVLLLAAMAYSTASALVVSLLSGDYRTANNVGGALIGPIILASVALVLLLPRGSAPWVLAAVLLALAAVAVGVALRWLSIERLLR